MILLKHTVLVQNLHTQYQKLWNIRLHLADVLISKELSCHHFPSVSIGIYNCIRACIPPGNPCANAAGHHCASPVYDRGDPPPCQGCHDDDAQTAAPTHARYSITCDCPEPPDTADCIRRSPGPYVDNPSKPNIGTLQPGNSRDLNHSY